MAKKREPKKEKEKKTYEKPLKSDLEFNDLLKKMLEKPEIKPNKKK